MIWLRGSLYYITTAKMQATLTLFSDSPLCEFWADKSNIHLRCWGAGGCRYASILCSLLLSASVTKCTYLLTSVRFKHSSVSPDGSFLLSMYTFLIFPYCTSWWFSLAQANISFFFPPFKILVTLKPFCASDRPFHTCFQIAVLYKSQSLVPACFKAQIPR